MRVLASVRKITGVNQIPGKDKIVQYVLDGWMVIDQKDKYQVGDLVVYCEPDTWVPTELAPFLTKGKEPREYLGIKGEKLKTIRMGGAISQGLLFPQTIAGLASPEGTNVTEILGLMKWEPLPPSHANAKSNFPSFIPKTDQERCQNLKFEFELMSGSEIFQVSEKLEGQSFTAYFRDGEFGVCSRNLELKIDEESVWGQTAKKYDLLTKMAAYGRNLAIQGEQVGPGIEGNIYNIPDTRLYVFDVFDIDAGSYLLPDQVLKITTELGLLHVPIIEEKTFSEIGNVENMLKSAHRKSELSPVLAEGLVFKSKNTSFSFKAVSNEYLLTDKKSTPWKD